MHRTSLLDINNSSSYTCNCCIALSLSAAQQSIHEAVYLKLDTSVDLGKLATSEGVIANARVAETVDALEQLTAGWCQQIEQVQNSLLAFRVAKYFSGNRSC